MIRILALAALIALPAPASAQEMPAADLAATVVFGVNAGSKGYLGKANLATVNQSGPGAFEIKGADGNTMALTITELEPCIFDVGVDLAGRTAPQLRFDATKLVDVTYTPRGADDNGLTLILIDPEVEPGMITRTEPDGTTSEGDMVDSFTTTVSLEELEAAVDGLKAACPSPGAAALGSLAKGAAIPGTLATLDLVAKVMTGTVSGADVAAHPAYSDYVRRVGEGVFEFDDGDGAPVMLTVTEFAPCVFDLDVSVQDESQGQLRLDATKLAGVTYTEGAETSGRRGYTIELKGKSGVISTVAADGSVSDAPSASQFESSVPVADLRAAAKAFLQGCSPA